MSFTPNVITTTKNFLENKYRKKGYLNAKVVVSTSEVVDTIQKKRVNMMVNIDKGEKIKIKKINFIGAEKVKSKKLRAAMKNTKQRNPIRIFKRSKYIEADYKDDLSSVIDAYKERGYRDARVVSDTIVKNDDKTISLNINVEEGEKNADTWTWPLKSFLLFWVINRMACVLLVNEIRLLCVRIG